jgi:hypothetical protein
MLEQQQKDRLEKAVGKSPNLGQDLKDRLLKQMSSFSPEAAKKLEDALIKEQEQMSRVEDKFRDREHKLKVDYLKVVGEFHKTGIKKAFKKWESLEDEEKSGKIDNILKEMEDPAGKKPKRRGILLLLLLLLLASAAAYYFVYYKP